VSAANAAADIMVQSLFDSNVFARVVVEDPRAIGRRRRLLRPNELRAAQRILDLYPSVREWADALDGIDRARLGSALYILQLSNYVIDALHDDPHFKAVGRRVSHLHARKPLSQKYPHSKIIAHASKLAKAGAKPHALAMRTRRDLHLPYSVRQTRTILQSAGLVPRRKGK
jgi:hypothetical protein